MSSTRSRMVNSVFWVSVGKYSNIGVNIIVSMVLARILAPSEFGVVTLASVCLAFIGMLSGMGLGPAIVQAKELTQKDLNSIFTFGILVAFFFALIQFGASWPIAHIYGDPQLIPVCQLLALSFFLGALNMVPGTLMMKYHRFKESSLFNLLANVIAAPIAIIAALKGFGVYSLLIAPFITSTLNFLYCNHFYHCRIDTHFSMAPIKKMASFSIFQLMFEIVNYFSRNMDKLIIGKSFSMTDLGYYDKAYRLMQMPQSTISGVLSPVLQPTFTHYQDNMEEMASKYLKVLSFLAAISFPIGVAMALCGPEIIVLMYGDRWELAIPCFQILSLSLPCAMLSSTTGALYQSCNSTKKLFIVGLVNSSLVVLLFFLAAHFGHSIESVAWAWTLYGVVGTLFTFAVLFCTVLRTSYTRFLKVLVKPLINCVLLAAVLILADKALGKDMLILSLLVKGILAAAVTLAFMQYSGELDIIGIIRSRTQKAQKDDN